MTKDLKKVEKRFFGRLFALSLIVGIVICGIVMLLQLMFLQLYTFKDPTTFAGVYFILLFIWCLFHMWLFVPKILGCIVKRYDRRMKKERDKYQKQRLERKLLFFHELHVREILITC